MMMMMVMMMMIKKKREEEEEINKNNNKNKEKKKWKKRSRRRKSRRKGINIRYIVRSYHSLVFIAIFLCCAQDMYHLKSLRKKKNFYKNIPGQMVF